MTDFFHLLFSRFIHVAACMSNSFLFMAEKYSIMWLNHVLFPHSLVDRHLDIFDFLAVMNNAAKWFIFMYYISWLRCCIFLLGHIFLYLTEYYNSCLNFLPNNSNIWVALGSVSIDWLYSWKWLFMCRVILDCILDIVNVVLWNLIQWYCFVERWCFCFIRQLTWLDSNFTLYDACGRWELRLLWSARHMSGAQPETWAGFTHKIWIFLLQLSPSWGSFPLSSDPGCLSLLLLVPLPTGTTGLLLEFSYLMPPSQMWLPSGQSHKNRKLAPCGLILLGFDAAPKRFYLCLPSRALLFLAILSIVCRFVYVVCRSVGLWAIYSSIQKQNIYIYIHILKYLNIWIYIYLKQKVHESILTYYMSAYDILWSFLFYSTIFQLKKAGLNVKQIASWKQPHSTGRSARCFVST